MRRIFDVCVVMMLYNAKFVLLDDHNHDDVSEFAECFFWSTMMFV